MMQLKRVLVSILVAVMMISMAVVAVSAADTVDSSFAVAVASADSEGNLPISKDDVLEVKIVITNNPGVSVASFAVVYDTTVLKYDSYAFGEIYSENVIGKDNLTVVPNETEKNKLHVFTSMLADVDVAETGLLVTLRFKVLESGKTNVRVESVKASNSNGVRIDSNIATGLDACSAIVGEMLAHVWSDATCAAPKTCEACGLTEGVVLDHTEEVIPAVDATCTETGLTEGKKCSVCGEILVAQEEIPATGHTEEVIPAVDATCTETGLTEGKKCSVCGEILVAQEVIPATGHTEEIVAGKAATCTETGLTEGKKCSVCGETTVAQEEIPATGHAEEVIPAVAATCTETGLTEGKKCSVCGETTVAQEEIPATGHTEEVIPAVAATCTETGLTEGKKCSVCGETTVAQETVAALGHTWTDATCTDAKTCSVCNATEGEANGHTYTNDCDADCDVCGETRTPAAHAYGEWKVVTEATKKAEGKQEKTCSVCGNVESEVIPMVKGGCNSVMGALAVVAMTMVGAAVVIRKKED